MTSRANDVDLLEPQAAGRSGPDSVLLGVLKPGLSEHSWLRGWPRALALPCNSPPRVAAISLSGWRVLSKSLLPCQRAFAADNAQPCRCYGGSPVMWRQVRGASD